MPIYDYRCDHCGHAFSEVQSFKDEPIQKCPNCGKRPRRLIVPSAIVFKGSGWYKTDSRPAEKSESTTEKKADAKSDSKTGDAKPSGQTQKRPPKSEAPS